MSSFKVLLLTLVAVVCFSSGKAWLFGDDEDDVYYYTHTIEGMFTPSQS